MREGRECVEAKHAQGTSTSSTTRHEHDRDARAREEHRARFPRHVTLRARAGLPPFREGAIAACVRAAIGKASRDAFRIVHFSIQANHLHLIIEAADKRALSRGMQGLAVRVARRVNGLLRVRGSFCARVLGGVVAGSSGSRSVRARRIDAKPIGLVQRNGRMNLRRGTIEDAQRCQAVMWASVSDFAARRGMPLRGTAEEWRASGGALQIFLARRAAEWWVAEEEGEMIGYARSIEREGLFELTEFFVLPARQAKGVGKALLERAFPADRGVVRSIIATTDNRALARYYAAGTSARFPILTLLGAPKPVPHELVARRFDHDPDARIVTDIERVVFEHARGEHELRFLAEEREGWIYTRGDAPIGFGFVGARGSGPIATLDPSDMPGVLSHIETRAAAMGVAELELPMPGPNDVGIRHLLGRGFRIDPWVNLLMSNRPFGRFDRVVPFNPPVFL